MSRDWNIIDDADEPLEPEPRRADDRLDRERIRRIAQARRAEDRSRLWKIGSIALCILSAIIVIARIGYWLAR